jgi:gliding motility-associated-like protein
VSCPVTLAKPRQTTTYRVQVKNDGGCSASDEITVNVICNKGNLFVPNTFSPNGDGVNDRFFPGGTGVNRIKLLRVFNRWGEVVFERRDFAANDPASGWDGKYKAQPLSPDVYIWSCEVVCQNNEVLTFKGDVTLLK